MKANLKRGEKVLGLAITVPMAVYLLIFLLVPLLMLFYYSFTDYSVIWDTSWVGFQNYIDIFRYPEYVRSFLITLLLAVILTSVGLITGLLIAVFMNALHRGKDFVRVIWYIPSLLSMAIVSQFMNMFLSPDAGLNNIIEALGGDAVIWQDSTFWMMFWITVLLTWKGLGSTVILFIAGLNSISADVYEAGKIDGVNRIQEFFFITMPLIRPMFGFILITGFMGAMNTFEPVMLISKGGPDRSTRVILYCIYDEAFANFKYGFSCALSVIVAFLTFGLTLLNIRFTDNSIFKVKEEDLQ